MQLCLSYCNGHNGTIPLNEDLEMPEAIKQCEHFRSCLESKNSSEAVFAAGIQQEGDEFVVG